MPNPLKLVAQVAWIAWTLVCLATLAATYGPVEPAKLPSGTPRMTRVVLPGAQDSSAAALSLIKFSSVEGFGQRRALTGGEQFAPVPLMLLGFLALGFLYINFGGPKVGQRKEAL